MAETKNETAEVAVEAAAPETVQVVENDGKAKSVSTTVWMAGKQAQREALFSQAIRNTRDAIPVAAYDVECKVVGTKGAKRDKTDGTVWEVAVLYTPRKNAPQEPVDLDRVIKEAKASYESHPGDPNFLEPAE
jgi:hypothetical protein